MIPDEGPPPSEATSLDRQTDPPTSSSKRKKRLIITGIIVVCLTIFWYFWAVFTPTIYGTVIDEKGLPVPEAWIWAEASIEYKTIGGASYPLNRLNRPHTRTGPDGTFTIPWARFSRGFPPLSFGCRINRVEVSARTFDDLYAEKDITGILSKKPVTVTLVVRLFKRSTENELHDTNQLYHYCKTGRYMFESPPVKGGCDAWELDYVIAKAERLRSGLHSSFANGPKTYCGGVAGRLGYLYELKKDYSRALTFFKEARDKDLATGFRWNLTEYQRKIAELEQKLSKKE